MIYISDNWQNSLLERCGTGDCQCKGSRFTNLNLDLMHGLPNQTCADAEQDLKTAISFQPEHISWYQLTIEPNTVFYRYPPVLPDEDTLFQIQERGMQLLDDTGITSTRYRHIHGLAGKAGTISITGNSVTILALAPGHMESTLRIRGVFRTSRTRMPKSYLRDPGKKVTPVAIEELPLEFMMNALRLTDGVDLSSYETRTGLPVETIELSSTRLMIGDSLPPEMKSDLTLTACVLWMRCCFC